MINSADNNLGKENPDISEGKDNAKPELIFKDSIQSPYHNDVPISAFVENRKYPWPVISIVLSLLCIIWLMENNSNLGINTDWILGIVYFLGLPLALISVLVFFVRIVIHKFSENLAMLGLKTFLVILPLLLIWGPVPFGVVSTFSSQKLDFGYECMGTENVTSQGTTETPKCIQP